MSVVCQLFVLPWDIVKIDFTINAFWNDKRQTVSWHFLVACTQLYKLLYLLVGWSIGWSVTVCSEHTTYGNRPCLYMSLSEKIMLTLRWHSLIAITLSYLCWNQLHYQRLMEAQTADSQLTLLYIWVTRRKSRWQLAHTLLKILDFHYFVEIDFTINASWKDKQQTFSWHFLICEWLPQRKSSWHLADTLL